MAKSSRVIYEPHPTQPGGLVPKTIIETDDKDVTVKDVKSGSTKTYTSKEPIKSAGDISIKDEGITSYQEQRVAKVEQQSKGSRVIYEDDPTQPGGLRVKTKIQTTGRDILVEDVPTGKKELYQSTTKIKPEEVHIPKRGVRRYPVKQKKQFNYVLDAPGVTKKETAPTDAAGLPISTQHKYYEVNIPQEPEKPSMGISYLPSEVNKDLAAQPGMRKMVINEPVKKAYDASKEYVSRKIKDIFPDVTSSYSEGGYSKYKQLRKDIYFRTLKKYESEEKDLGKDVTFLDMFRKEEDRIKPTGGEKFAFSFEREFMTGLTKTPEKPIKAAGTGVVIGAATVGIAAISPIAATITAVGGVALGVTYVGSVVGKGLGYSLEKGEQGFKINYEKPKDYYTSFGKVGGEEALTTGPFLIGAKSGAMFATETLGFTPWSSSLTEKGRTKNFLRKIDKHKKDFVYDVKPETYESVTTYDRPTKFKTTDKKLNIKSEKPIAYERVKVVETKYTGRGTIKSNKIVKGIRSEGFITQDKVSVLKYIKGNYQYKSISHGGTTRSVATYKGKSVLSYEIGTKPSFVFTEPTTKYTGKDSLSLTSEYAKRQDIVKSYKTVSSVSTKPKGKYESFDLLKTSHNIYEKELGKRIWVKNTGYFAKKQHYLGSPGDYNPATGEIRYASDLPKKNIKSTLAHEMGHKIAHETNMELPSTSKKQITKLFKERKNYQIWHEDSLARTGKPYQHPLSGELEADLWRNRLLSGKEGRFKIEPEVSTKIKATTKKQKTITKRTDDLIPYGEGTIKEVSDIKVSTRDPRTESLLTGYEIKDGLTSPTYSFYDIGKTKYEFVDYPVKAENFKRVIDDSGVYTKTPTTSDITVDLRRESSFRFGYKDSATPKPQTIVESPKDVSMKGFAIQEGKGNKLRSDKISSLTKGNQVSKLETKTETIKIQRPQTGKSGFGTFEVTDTIPEVVGDTTSIIAYTKQKEPDTVSIKQVSTPDISLKNIVIDRQSTYPSTNLKEIPVLISKPEHKLKPIIKTKISIKPDSSIKTRSITQPKVSTKQTEKQITKPSVIHKQITQPSLITKQVTPSTPTYKSFDPLKPIIPVPLPFGYKKSKRRKEQSAFDVYLKRGGKFRKVASRLPYKKALEKGRKSAVTTLGATFKLEQRGTTREKDIFGKPSLQRFREYKVVKGRKVKTPLTFIQKAKYRLGTIGEKSEIKGAKKKKKKRGLFL